MGITLRKSHVSDVGMFLQNLSRLTWLSLGCLLLVRDLTMKKGLAISYINWLGAEVVPLMSPW